jgi:hypothetical protein
VPNPHDPYNFLTKGFKDQLGVPMRKISKGEHAGKYRGFIVLTPHSGETLFASKTKAMDDFRSNKKHEVPSYVAEAAYSFGQDGLIIDVFNAHAAYRDEEID